MAFVKLRLSANQELLFRSSQVYITLTPKRKLLQNFDKGLNTKVPNA